MKFVAYALLPIIAALLVLGGLTDGQGWGGDYAAYLMQARSLCEGTAQAYAQANRFTIEQSSFPIAPVTYPWGFPAMLALIYASFGMNLFALKLVAAGCFVALIPVLLRGFAKAHSGFWLFCLAGLFALNPVLISYTDHIISDLPFMLVSTIVVLMIGRVAVRRQSILNPWADAILLGALIAFACTIRTTGVLLAGTLLLTHLWRWWFSRSDRQADGPRDGWVLTALPYCVFIGILAIVSLALPSANGSYASQLDMITLGRIKYHLVYYAKLLADFYEGVPFHKLFYLASVPLALYGAWLRRCDGYHIALFIGLVFGLYILWPSEQGLRFLFPVLPFYVSYCLTALERLERGVKCGETEDAQAGPSTNRARTVLCRVPVLLLLLSFAVVSGLNVYKNIAADRDLAAGPYTESAQEMFAYVRSETAESDTIAFCRPRIMRLLTDRQTVEIREADRLDIADYLCIYQSPHNYHQIPEATRNLLTENGQLQRVYANDEFVVYKITQ